MPFIQASSFAYGIRAAHSSLFILCSILFILPFIFILHSSLFVLPFIFILLFSLSILPFIFYSSFFILHSSFNKIFLPFFGHYFRVIQCKKGYLFSSKQDRTFSKIARLLRLRLYHSRVRPYRQRGRSSITLRLGPCHHAVRYSIAGGKIGK